MKDNFFRKIKKPFLVAEISANHNGSFKSAKKLIYTAKRNGADAVKLQTYKPSSITIKSPRPEFKIKNGIWKNQTLWNLFNKGKTPFEWHKQLFKYAKKIGILCFSSPFDSEAVDLLESINCPIYKLSSFEITDFSLIKKISKTKKPMIISTGLSPKFARRALNRAIAAFLILQQKLRFKTLRFGQNCKNLTSVI